MPTPTRQELRALHAFCQVERQAQEYTASTRPVNRELLDAKRRAISAALHIMQHHDVPFMELPEEMRAATGRKYVRIGQSHATKELSDKFVTTCVEEHYDEFVNALHGVQDVAVATQVLTDNMWDVLKAKRTTYTPTLQFSNMKPRNVAAADAAPASAITANPRLASALLSLHEARVAYDDNKRRARDFKLKIAAEREKVYEKVKDYMERTKTEKQELTGGDDEYTIKYVTSRRSLPLTAADCKDAVQTAVQALLTTNQELLAGGSTDAGAVLRRNKAEILKLLVDEMKTRRGQTQKSVVRLMKKRGGAQGGQEDEEEEEEERSDEE